MSLHNCYLDILKRGKVSKMKVEWGSKPIKFDENISRLDENRLTII